jgi:hypothetical protein
MSPLWLTLWTAFFSLSWLLPVHFPPWSTFPADVWTAGMGLLGALAVLIRTRSALNWHALPCLVAGLVFLPWVQYFLGLLPYAGQAWMSSAYLLGFLLALLVGARWEQASPDQLAHALFTAIGMAAIASVGLQLYSWLGLSDSGAMGMWSLGVTGGRPYANLGQPNQLATLLLWGLIACLWAYLRRAISGATAVFVVAFLLLGLALTQSRAGFLSLTVILGAVWFWRGLWSSRLVPRVALGLYIYFLTCSPLLRWLNAALLLGQDDLYLIVQRQGDLRLSAWRLFVQAIVDRPWLGYGWTDVSSAQMAVADQFSGLGGIFQQSHNLFLDLMLWTGVPIGLLITGILVRWFWRRLRAVRQPEDVALFLLLTVVGIHALVEFPLQYAYFLLPIGLVMGILNVRLGARVVASTPYGILSGLWLSAALVVGVTVRDYAHVDASYTLLRLEQSIIGQGRGTMGGPPDVWVLTQLREWILVTRYKAREGMSQQELAQLAMLTRTNPSLSLAYRLATALALNNRPGEARAWLGRICKFTDEEKCRLAQDTWARESPNDPRTAAIRWPK